jgi:hypothetical protein
VLAQLPTVKRDADNATAAAFRTAQPRVVPERPQTQGALVVPLLTPTGCAGVLAIELQRGRLQSDLIVAGATILAAQLAPLAGCLRRARDLPQGRLATGGLAQIV